MIVPSDGNPGCYELSYTTPECVGHKFIETTVQGVRFERSPFTFERQAYLI
jgi:hypothetical protein